MLLLRGSGKTAVLVERIIHKIIEEKIDIDKLLVVTFTNAAASEMRERILQAIYKKIEENPNDIHMQRQITLLNKSSICTIHSFCLDVIRNYFYEIDTSANFRIGDSAEIELLKQDIIENIFEEKYANKNAEFLDLIDTYTTYRDDDPLKQLILKIEKYIQSNPFPEEWLEEKIEMFNLEEKLEQDFSNTIWGKILLEELLEEIIDAENKLEVVKQKLQLYPELEKYVETISYDIQELEKIEKIINSDNKNKWDITVDLLKDFKFVKWPIDKKANIEYKNEAKQIRDKVKKDITLIMQKKFALDSKQANDDIFSMHKRLKALKNIILEFEEKYAEKKKEKNIIDFHDIEHFALKILIKKDENNEILPTEVAKKISEKYEEIAIDEYQDSNLVQEYILTSISRKNNIFMVGDVKQSIYRFRQAMPELFLNKYNTYTSIDEKEKSNGNKIKLFKNFRSRENILKITNIIFEEIMSKKLGDIDYNEEEYLNLGADYQNPENEEIKNYAGKAKLAIIDLKKESEDEENEESTETIEKNVLEAKLVAQNVQELINSNYMVYEKGKYRKITYRDIVILLRTTSNIAPIYEKELLEAGFPVFCDTTAEYLDSIEIQTIMSVLKILDNPLQDIPLVTVLRSPIGNFSDNDLVEIRLFDRNSNFYISMKKARISVKESLRNKIDHFFEMLEEWKKFAKQKPLDELIWKIYTQTNYYYYVGLLTNGKIRQANLKMLFQRARQYEKASFKGLYNFINFIDKLKTNSGDLSAAKVIGENDNVIRIMSIHKSKGLEFPVVFLSGTGKQFNVQDLNESILLHQKIGFGPKYRDVEKQVEYPTLAKEAIKIKTKQELLAEEMRVLYVALTRAKEKIIITGVQNDVEKEIKEKEEYLKIGNQEKIKTTILKKETSYLEWLLTVYFKREKELSNIMDLKVYSPDEIKIVQTETEKIDLLQKFQNIKIEENKIQYIKNELEWQYKYLKASQIPTKSSVTKIKEKNMQQANEQLENEKIEQSLEIKIPNFAKINTQMTNAQKGTLIHLCMQLLENNKDYAKQEIEQWLENLERKEIITQNEKQAIPISIFIKYVNSNLWKELKQAKEIHKEEPFYLNIQASNLFEDESLEEKIIVQGIIDLYYINNKGELVLVDYKTDYIEKGQEEKLVQKYEEQIKLYKQALEKSLNRKVDKVVIYSTWIGEIEIKENN